MGSLTDIYLIPAIFFAVPLIVAALGELVVEGVVNIGIEGMMLAGALGAAVADAWWGRCAALVVGAAAACALALPFAWATLVFAADQIVVGTGINLLALGLTGMIFQRLPGAWQDQIVGISPRVLVWATPLLALAVGAFLRFTRAGLELRAIGEAPQAADTAGVNVRRRQFYAILFGAACAGVGGAYLSIMYVRTFGQNMTDGVGFLALAMVIFGRWKAGGIVAAGLFFGLVRALAGHLQTQPGFSPAVLEMFGMLPYVVSLLALAGVSGQSGAPAALCKPFVRE